MKKRIDPMLREHWRHLLEVFRDAELAEARAEYLKPYLDCLELSGLLNGHVILGESLLPLYTAPVEGGSHSGLYCQAALLVPGGLGVVLWSSAEHDELSQVPEGLEAQARTCFRPFGSCRPVVQQWLLPQIDGMFRQLFDIASRYATFAGGVGPADVNPTNTNGSSG